MSKTDYYFKLLECNDILRNNINKYKEAFIMYYGRDKSDLINEKFSNVLLIGCLSTDSISDIITNIKKEKSFEIYNKILSSVDTYFTIDDLFGDDILDFPSLLPISNYLNFYKLHNLGKDGRIDTFIKKGFDKFTKFIDNNVSFNKYEGMVRNNTLLDRYSADSDYSRDIITFYGNLDNADYNYKQSFDDCLKIFDKIDANINLDNISDYINSSKFKNLNSILDLFLDGINEYNNYVDDKLSKYQVILDNNRKAKEKIGLNSYKKIINKYQDLFPFVVADINDLILIMDSFSSIADVIINSNDDDLSWEKQSIFNDRIQYFKLLGYDFGDDYLEYINNDVIKKLLPDSKKVDSFIEEVNSLVNKLDVISLANLDEFKNFRKEIDKLDLLDKDDAVRFSIYDNGSIFLNPNIIKNKENYSLYNLLIINFGSLVDGFTDHYICHELNHLYELSLIDVKDDNYNCVCGWDILHGRINQDVSKNIIYEEFNEEARSYEYFNEVINELISQDISELMQDNNLFIFDSNEKSNFKGRTNYELSAFLIKDFYNEFKDDIIESRSNGNIEYIWNKVGKENFDELNNLFNIYYQNIGGYNYYALNQSLSKREDNDLTKVYYDLIKKKDKIMDNIRNYYSSNNNVLSKGKK